MLDQTLLAGFIVVGGHQQHSVHAKLFGTLGETNAMCRIVAAGSGDHRNTVIHFLYAVINHTQMLCIRHGGRLTGSAAHHNGIGMPGNLVFNNSAEFFKIHSAVSVHRGDDRNSSAGKNGFLHHKRFTSL